MFKRVSFEDWSGLIAIISFVLVASVFVIGTIRAFSMPKKKRDHLANLPLEGDTSNPVPTNDSTPAPTKPLP